ncbi:phosphocholine cytidylyltransferase family protein [Geodermatophilus sp. URMC 64]
MPNSDVLVVLAAGVGSRLGSMTATAPKWLLPVGGGTIADRQLGALGDLFDLRRQLLVVTGHGAQEVAGYLDRQGLPQDCTLYNDEFATLNNWYSVLLALRKCADSTGRVFLLNSDLYAPSSLYHGFVTHSRSAAASATLAVDGVRPLTAEAMKVAVNGGRITDIGKVGVPDPAGEYVGMLMLGPEAAGLLREAMEDWLTSGGNPNGWYETVIHERLLDRVDCRAVEVGGSLWVEIDDPADLETAGSVAP